MVFASNRAELWSLFWKRVDGSDEAKLLLKSDRELRPTSWSPDGRSLALDSKHPVSTEGGTEPMWSADGKELFYRVENQMMTVRVTTEPTFAAETPRLFSIILSAQVTSISSTSR